MILEKAKKFGKCIAKENKLLILTEQKSKKGIKKVKT